MLHVLILLGFSVEKASRFSITASLFPPYQIFSPLLQMELLCHMVCVVLHDLNSLILLDSLNICCQDHYSFLPSFYFCLYLNFALSIMILRISFNLIYKNYLTFAVKVHKMNLTKIRSLVLRATLYFDSLLL